MKPERPIARRIAWVLTGLVSLAVTLAALVSYEVYYRMQERMIDELITTESERLVKRVSRFGDRWQGPFEREMAPSMFAWGETAALPAAGMPPELRGLAPGLHYLPRGSSTWHVFVAPAMDGRLYVMYDSIVVEEQERRYALALLSIVAVFSLLAFLVSVRVSRWLVSPLNVLVDRLARWAPGGLQAGVRHANEVDRLMDAFNRVQDQVDAAIADQRQFSANLHHEVRTPLTVIRSDAELLLRLQPSDGGNGAGRLHRIIQSVDEIRQSLESTYGLSQAHGGRQEPVRLRDCVEDVGEGLRVEAADAGLAFVNGVAPEQVERLNRYALLTVVRNIVRNAILHAAPGRLEIRSTPSGLTFTDTGPGIGPAELPYIFDRYYSRRRVDAPDAGPLPGDEETAQPGLGLAIAMRVCLQQSWTLSAESPVAQGRGTRFTLVFESHTLPP